MNELSFSFKVSPYFPSELIQKQDDQNIDYFDVKSLMPQYQVVVNNSESSVDPIFLRNNDLRNVSNRNTVKVVNDGEARYLYQHDARRIENGNTFI